VKLKTALQSLVRVVVEEAEHNTEFAKTPKRIIDRIVDYSLARAVKGDVFLR
jgi:hypothetical protein